MDQPSHTVYGGAHLFRAGTVRKLGDRALADLRRYGLGPRPFAAALGVPEALAEQVWERTAAKLRTEPIEDYRIDFEDGYGVRSDDEEDADAVRAARELARALREGGAPRCVGLRPKPVATHLRFHRTLSAFVRELAAGAPIPAPFLVTLPKPSSADEVEIAADALCRLEDELGLAPRALSLELMLETPEALMDAEGRCPLPRLVDAGDGRVVAVHLGAYDLTAAIGVTASDQSLSHPICDLARATAALALSRRGTWLADGATTRLPVGPHRGESLSEAEEAENREVVHRAWAEHAGHVRRAAAQGFPQGWDLHPAQLPARFGVLAAWFLGDLPEMAARLRNFVGAAARATRVGASFDDAASARGLVIWFRRGLASGLLTADDLSAAGLVPGDLPVTGSR